MLFAQYSIAGVANGICLASLLAASIGITFALFFLVRHRIRQLVLWQIPGPPCPSFMMGNFRQIFNPISGIEFREHVWKTYGSVSRFNGPCWDQILMISDPVALTSIVIQHQEIFEESEWSTEVFRHAIGPGLLSTTGALHQRQRKLLNSIFSTQRMRSLVPLLNKITNQLRDIFDAKAADGPQELDMVDWFGRLALEMIGQGGLGHTFNSFSADVELEANKFRTAVKEFVPMLARLHIYLPVFPLVSRWPAKLLRFGAACLPLKDVHYFLRILDIMHVSAQRLFDAKSVLLAEGEAGLASQVGGGNDIVSVLMKTTVSAESGSQVPDEEIMAQMLTLLGAATETISNTMLRIAYLLAQNQDVQNKLRAELDEAVASADRDLDHDELTALPYLDAIYRETLRLHPPASFVTRVNRTDMTIPVSEPIPGAKFSDTSVFVPRNTTIIVDVLGVNCSEKIWGADACTWKPERWLTPLPESVADAHIPGVYSNMMTFLGGNRSCIGFKLSELELKVAMSQLVRSFRFLPSKIEVVWRLGPMMTPSVKGSDALTPKMPMVLERIESEK
ncbi:cytochrome P450 [Artomyces pyxidatus]|uniref:Cytochrome P450 n=1 Tax=Artomyces pyxidatus TaxID=48021 RepID=A0ACB8SH27_9AGAM|nr:cytochrome P450 [Artomyces pyxidatus]